MTTDNRVYTVKALQQFFDNCPQDNNYYLDFRYNNKDTGRGFLQGSRATAPVVYQFVEHNERLSELQVTRIHIYKETDPRHALVSFSRDLLYKLISGSPGYDPNAPRLSYDIGEVETRTARLQILMRPSIKRELKRQADLHGTTMSTVIDDLVANWINQLQTSE